MKKITLYSLAVIVVAIIIVRLFVGNAAPQISYINPEIKPNSTTLVIVLHAFTNTRDDMKDVIDVIRSVYPNSDISSPNYNSGIFSNASLTDTAAQLNDSIQDLMNEKNGSAGYDEIILVGHSIGALLARKIYLYSLGGSPDHPLGARGNKAKKWSGEVTRIILLAGMNRGWSKENMEGKKWISAYIGEAIHWLLNQGKMVMSIKRGSPFVVNLKLEWIRLVNSGRQMPQVTQLLGDDDRVAPTGDHKELMASPKFVFIPVSGTKHANIIDMLDTDSPQVSDETDPEYRIRNRRKAAFVAALKEPSDVLRQKYGSNNQYLDSLDPERMSVNKVVFIMHGIRDHGEWVTGLAKKIEDKDPNIRTITSKYGYFPMARFLLFSDREENVRWFVDKYTETISLYPNSTEFSFIGHSNGTYLLASALQKYNTVKFDKIYFAGSVVRTDFPWVQYIPGRAGIVRNDLAADDWVVAWFPKLFQILRKQLSLNPDGFFNLGSAGFDGFESDRVNKNQGRVLGGHGAALINQDSIVDYIINGSVVDLPQETNEANKTIGLFSNIAWFVWLVLGVVIVVGAKLFAKIKPLKNGIGKSNCYFIYGLFITAIIYTI